MHSRVKGTLPEDAGELPAGTPYSAHDPELMLWTIAPAADSAVYFYELFVRELSDAERDEFWADYVRFGELFGMDSVVAPTSWRELREYVDAKINGPDAYLTEEALVIGRAVMLEIPTSAVTPGGDAGTQPRDARLAARRASASSTASAGSGCRRARLSRGGRSRACGATPHAALRSPRVLRRAVRRRRRRRARAHPHGWNRTGSNPARCLRRASARKVAWGRHSQALA